MTSRGGRQAQENPPDWEDKYLRLKSEYDELNVHCNKQKDDMRKLKTKTEKLESDFAQMSRGEGVPRVPVQKGANEDDFVFLQEDNKRLKLRVNKLLDEIKACKEELEKKKREVANLKRIAATRKTSDTVALTGKKRSAPGDPEIEIEQAPLMRSIDGSERIRRSGDVVHTHSAAIDDSQLQLLNTYKTRMINAEKQVEMLRAELGRAPTGRESSRDDGRDSNYRLQQLQVQYDHLQARAVSQDKTSKESERKLEEYSQRVRDLRRVLEDLRNEKEISDIKANRVNDLEDEAAELRRMNRSLEEKISRLCESPFISDAFGKEESRMRFDDLLGEKEEFRLKVEHLQEAIRTQYNALVTLKQHSGKLLQERDDAVNEVEALRKKYKDLEEGHHILQAKLLVFAGTDNEIDMDALERALTLVKRRNVAVEKLDLFATDGEIESIFPGGIATTEKRLVHMQEINLRLAKEVDRLEGMLRIQSDVNRQLNKELEQWVGKRDKDKTDLVSRCEGFEEMAKKRLDKIHVLEAQVRQLVYGNKYLGKAGGNTENDFNVPNLLDNSDEIYELENPLLNVLLEEKNGADILPDENLLEVWIKGANIKNGVLRNGTSTFVVIDFFDFESQTTSLLSGNKPQWDFAATYKLVVDDFFLRYLATNVLTLELNMAFQGDFAVVGRCTVPLSPILQMKPVLHVVNHPVLSTETGAIIGNISLDVRLAMPVFELYRLFLERHPEEEQQIREIAAKRAMATASLVQKGDAIDTALEVVSAVNVEDESRLYNELDIEVIRVSGLSARGVCSVEKTNDGAERVGSKTVTVDVKPSPYVHFQFLGYPDKFTAPQQNTSDAVFNECFSFPMTTTEQQLRLLRRTQLVFTVIDMKAENGGEDELNLTKNGKLLSYDTNGIVGEVRITLGDLIVASSAENDVVLRAGTIEGVYDVKNIKTGDKVGALQIRIKWRSPLRTERQLGTRALSGADVEKIISCSSASDVSDGLVNYRHFCRVLSPPRTLRRVIDDVRLALGNMSKVNKKPYADICKLLFDISNGNEVGAFSMSEVVFVEHMLKLQFPGKNTLQANSDILPRELSELFRYVDYDEDNSITVNELLVILNLHESRGLPLLLFEKLRERVADLENYKVPLITLFEDVDRWGADGVIGRADFKQVLKKMGFMLVDEPLDGTAVLDSTYRMERARASDGYRKSMDNEATHGDLLNDSINSTTDQHVGLVQDRSDRRNAFESQLREVESHSAKHDTLRNLKAPSTAKIDPYPNSEHHVGVENKTAVIHSQLSNYSKDQLDSSATKLQAQFRGHMARSGKTVPPSTSAVKKSSEEPVPSKTNNQFSFLAAEELLRKNIYSLREPPNFLGTFEKVDKQNTGFVNRMQFAHVLRQFPQITLEPQHLRMFMDYFDSSQDANGNKVGEKINYVAFVKFCNCGHVELQLPTIKLLKKIVLHRDAVLNMKKCDNSGNGIINRANTLRVLANSGYAQVKEAKLIKVLKLFEMQADGDINYGNFIEYTRETPNGLYYVTLVESLRRLILNSEKHNVKEWFDIILNCGKVDGKTQSRANYENLLSFLREYDLIDEHTPKEISRCLFISIDVTTEGISLDDFNGWIRNQPTDAFYASLFMMVPMKLNDLQRKTQRYLALVKSEGGDAALNELKSSYLLYDFASTNVLTKELFIHISKQLACFPYTFGELRLIASEFKENKRSNGDNYFVNYKRFLAWASPAADSGIALESSTEDSELDSKKKGTVTVRSSVTPAHLSRFLESSVQRGVDVMSIFGRYDPDNAGRISIVDFIAALGDMGMSAGIHQNEAVAFADSYRSALGEFILYRRLISELLNQVDDKTGAITMIDIVEVFAAIFQRNNISLDVVADNFERLDRKNNGRVTDEDLSDILLDKLNLFKAIKKADIEELANKYSVANGWFQYTSFLGGLKLKMNGKGNFGTSKKELDSTISDDLLSRLRGHFEELILRGIDFRSEFESYDLESGDMAASRNNGTGGIIALDSFKYVLQDILRYKITARDLNNIKSTYFSTENNGILYHSFLYDVHPMISSSIDRETWMVAEELRRKIRRKVPSFLIPGELKKAFKHFVVRREDGNLTSTIGGLDSATVTCSDLSVAVGQLGMKISKHVENGLFKLMNLNPGGDDVFGYTEFVVFVCDPYHRDLIWKIKRSLNRSKGGRNFDESDVCDRLLKDGDIDSNLLSPDDFRKSMSIVDIELSESDVKRLLYRFGVGNNSSTAVSSNALTMKRGKVIADDFINVRRFCAFLRGQNDLEVGNDERLNSISDGNRILFKKLKSRVIDKLNSGFTANEIYSYFDGNDIDRGNYDLDVASLMRGLRSLGVIVQDSLSDKFASSGSELSATRTEVKGLLRQLCAVVRGPVNSENFFKALAVNPGDYSKSNRDNDRRKNAQRGKRYEDDSDEQSVRTSSRLDDQNIMSAELEEVLAAIWRDLNSLSSRADIPRLNSSADLISYFQELLDKYDENYDGQISQRELSRVFLSLKVRNAEFSQDMLLSLFDILDKKLTGMISTEQLVRLLQRYVKNNGQRGDVQNHSPLKSFFTRRPDLKEKIIVSQLQPLLEKDSELLQRLNDEYRKMDIDRSGCVSASEIVSGLFRIGVRLRSDDEKDFVDSLLEVYAGTFDKENSRDSRRFNADLNSKNLKNSNVVNFSDWVKLLSSELKTQGASGLLTERFVKMINEVMKSSGRKLLDVFEYLDRDGDGQIDMVDFEKGLNKLFTSEDISNNFSPEDFQYLFKKISTGSSASYRSFSKIFDSIANDDQEGDADFDTLIRRMKVQLHDKFGSLSNAVRQLKMGYEDVIGNDRIGSVSKRDLFDILNATKASLVQKEDINLIFKKLGNFKDTVSGNVTVVNFEELLSFFEPDNETSPSTPVRQSRNARSPPGSPGRRSPSSPRRAGPVNDTLQSIKNRLQYLNKNSKKSSISALESTFQSLSKSTRGGGSSSPLSPARRVAQSSGSGYSINKSQFAQAMDTLNLHLRNADIDALFATFSRKERGSSEQTMDYKDFMDALTSSRERSVGSSFDNRSSSGSRIERK